MHEHLRTWRLWLCLAAAAVASTVSAAEPVSPRYNRDIRPILSDNCFACHGPDRANRAADLRLDDREAAIGAKAIIPGKPAESLVLQRITSADPEALMPPPDSHKKLSAAQKELLARWIAAGAVYEPHWAFAPPAPISPPAVKHPAWPKNDVDRFILARLEQEGLVPAAEADRELLMRRVTLDLTGLPPTPAEVAAFAADTSADAYEKLVDRLLASPRYGERMAVDWLDAARYADSNGYQVDRDRELWPWRDWVIKAFNDNKPFDQFTIEQLAGDLLPGATFEQRVATGFHRNHMLNEEGGVIGEEFLAEYTADRVETTAAVWLGQTFNCCRCHDHKYDPFTQRDFYALKAFFHNVPERGVGAYGTNIRINAPPFVRLPHPELDTKLAGLNDRRQQLEKELAAVTAATAAGLEAWATQIARDDVPWQAVPVAVIPDSGPVPAPGPTADIPAHAKQTTFRLRAGLPAGLPAAVRLRCVTQATAADAAAAGQVVWRELRLERTLQVPLAPQPLVLRAAVSGDSQPEGDAAKLTDGNAGTGVTGKLDPARPVEAVFEIPGVVTEDAARSIDVEVTLAAASAGTRWSIDVTNVAPERLVPTAVKTIAAKPPASWTPAERKQLLDTLTARMPTARELTSQVAAVKAEISAAELQIPTTLVMEEMPKPRDTFILMRGAYDKPGEKVVAATPAVLPPLPADLPANRLGLAQWLVSPGHPLTARVTVNRLWQQVFGTGLVKTSEDFGAQGAAPSHPELLDWLAQDFVRGGWDVKRFLKMLVTSATYRQRPAVSADLAARDPENRLLARGPWFRLSGEFIRDQALAASGLLVDTIGGPSVRPYHPAGIYEQLTAGGTTNSYREDTGPGLHRRSLYTYWKRSVPHPGLLVFDVPFRETCTLRRSRSNTPLQALNLMNDPTYVEAARFLGQRMLREGGSTPEARIAHGFRLLLARSPRPEELAVLVTAHGRFAADFRGDVPAAKALLAVGTVKPDAALDPVELAAYAAVASTLLNLDETVTKP